MVTSNHWKTKIRRIILNLILLLEGIPHLSPDTASHFVTPFIDSGIVMNRHLPYEREDDSTHESLVQGAVHRVEVLNNVFRILPSPKLVNRIFHSNCCRLCIFTSHFFTPWFFVVIYFLTKSDSSFFGAVKGASPQSNTL